MKTKFEIGNKYTDHEGNEITITDIKVYGYANHIYYESVTKCSGLVDIFGLYFLENSIYSNELKPYNP